MSVVRTTTNFIISSLKTDIAAVHMPFIMLVIKQLNLIVTDVEVKGETMFIRKAPKIYVFINIHAKLIFSPLSAKK